MTSTSRAGSFLSQIILATTLIGPAVVTYCAIAQQAPQQGVHAPIIAPAERKRAPAFHLTDPSGAPAQLSDYRGKVVLLNFWATGCGGSKIEIPELIEFQQSYQDKGFTVLGISADMLYESLKSPEDALAKVKPFILEHHLNYPVAMADDSIITSYGLHTVPATFLIDRSGRVAAMYVGIIDKSDVESNIKQLLAEQ